MVLSHSKKTICFGFLAVLFAAQYEENKMYLAALVLETLPASYASNFIGSFLFLTSKYIFPLASSLGLIDTAECFPGETPLVIYHVTPKSGVFFSADLSTTIARRCGKTMTMGWSTDDNFPANNTLAPDYESDQLLTVGNTREWTDYAFNKDFNKNKKLVCLALTRNPFDRFMSLYKFTRDGGEQPLKAMAEIMKGETTFERRLEVSWNGMFRDLLDTTHTATLESINIYNCSHIDTTPIFGSSEGFNSGLTRMLQLMGMTEEATQLLLQDMQDANLGSLTAEEREQNVHVSGKSLEKGEKEAIQRLIQEEPYYSVLKGQCKDLGYECK